jgi:hypothetical protein
VLRLFSDIKRRTYIAFKNRVLRRIFGPKGDKG